MISNLTEGWLAVEARSHMAFGLFYGLYVFYSYDLVFKQMLVFLYSDIKVYIMKFFNN